jgi:hypothetical protein
MVVRRMYQSMEQIRKQAEWARTALSRCSCRNPSPQGIIQ